MPDSIEGTFQFELRCDVACFEPESSMSAQVLQVLGRAGDQIVQPEHLAALRQQPVTEMRADESGRPRNKMSQLVLPQDILSVPARRDPLSSRDGSVRRRYPPLYRTRKNQDCSAARARSVWKLLRGF